MKLLLALSFAASLAAADAVPSWVREVAKQEAPPFPAKVSAVVLFQEEHLTVGADGQRTIRQRAAIKIVQPSRETIRAFRSYNAKTGRIREIQAWLIPVSGKETVLGKDQSIDTALSQSDAYNEYRAKSLACPGSAAPGSVFAYEIVEEETSVFTQYVYEFQDRDPVLLSRFILTLPPGWQASPVLFNHPGLEPGANGNTQTWELRDLAWIEDEDYSPEPHAIAPRLGVTWFSEAANVRALKDWASVSAWVSGFVDPAAAVDPTITAKAAELAKDASTELDKIRAVAAFVQETNYVSIQMNLNRGGGYAPHPAADVLKKNYGDCKDKATLMRAMLKSLGIDSHVVVIFSGDRDYVKREWPSPLQFNHAIVAVRVSDTTSAPTVFAHPTLGRLLIFDPTASKTPLGDLPVQQQGSYALVLAGDKGDLVKAPLLPAAANRVESEIEGELDVNATLQAKLVRRYFGQSATSMRYRSDDASELKKTFERALSRRLGGVTIASVRGVDAPERYEATVEFAVDQFGQLMQGRLLLVRPCALSPGNDYGFAAKERKLPVRIPARVSTDRVRIKIPSGFAVDELPDPIALETEYGKYKAAWTVEGQQILFEQTVEVADVYAPASDYDKLRQFFDRVAAGESGAVVFLKR